MFVTQAGDKSSNLESISNLKTFYIRAHMQICIYNIYNYCNTVHDRFYYFVTLQVHSTVLTSCREAGIPISIK